MSGDAVGEIVFEAGDTGIRQAKAENLFGSDAECLRGGLLFGGSGFAQVRLVAVGRFPVRYGKDGNGKLRAPLQSDEAAGAQGFIIGMGRNDDGGSGGDLPGGEAVEELQPCFFRRDRILHC